MNEIINITGLNKYYGRTHVLSDVTVSIPEHSITGLIGRNGSGKTTLMKILSGMLDMSKGFVEVFGMQPMDNLSVLNKLVYTYHNMEYDRNLNLRTILAAYKIMFTSFDLEFANKLMKYFELNNKMKYKNLSQGMASIFNFLCALACRVPITMFDEPVLGMDVTVRKSAYEILLRDYTEYPRTFIISSHLLSELEGVLSDILLIEQGKVVLHKPIDDIRQSAYRIDGNERAVKNYVLGKNVITQKINGFSCFAIIYESYHDFTAAEAKAQGLEISPVRAEDLCIYLTRQDKEEELKCLW